ncbi:protein NRT1/ PTR FAMILY 8.3-like [Oryza glaberrima]|uniref:protein NRT1/ PTR FAMILY 8.3-like n=1 Tax=Oryza glaberrima TaxID=4538 RepID=UPI00224C17F6|nr:protein NRT1/ PTR FAMILY 8.3-like [Oryza glaberrima]
MVWLQDNFGWLVGFGVPALCTVLAMVVVAAIRKRNVALPHDSFVLYDGPPKCGQKLAHTDQFRFLDNAARLRWRWRCHRWWGGEAAAAAAQPWRLCTVTQVDELKVIVRMLPVWARATGIVYCMVLVQQPLFTVQGRAMRRRLGFGADAFAIPAASLHSVYAAAMLILVPLYDAAVVPAVRRLTSNERGLTEMQRIGAGMTLSVAAMAAAATVEGRRLAVGKAAARLGSGKRRAEQQFGGGGDGAVSATTSSPRRQRGAGCWKRRARPWRQTS